MRRWLIGAMLHPILLASLVVPSLALTSLASPSLAVADRRANLVVAQADTISVTDAWARASAGSATVGAVYATVTGGAQADQLVGVSTPVAAKAEAHESFTENGVMKMRPAPNVAIPPNKAVTFAPGGYHIMLLGLRQPLRAGQDFPLTLTFAHTAPVTVDVKVQPLGRTNSMDDHTHPN